jgi:hypothetical protein
MHPVLRVVWIIMVFIATYVVSWMLFLLLPLGSFSWLGSIAALAVAIMMARYTWRHADEVPATFTGAIVIGAVSLGAIGFVAGFFGPMIFAPEANQGPMLGIFITGPGGAIVGAIMGLVYRLINSRR